MFSFFKPKKTITELFTSSFIDIHSHLIPGIDDGSKSSNDSIALIKKMKDFGIHHFVTTPHIMDGVWNNTKKQILEKLETLQSLLKQENITDITIRAAAEYMMDHHFLTLLAKNELLPIKDSKLLVEMSYLNPPVNLYDILFKIQVAGYQPILAHPERYLFLHNNYSEYQKLKTAGCFFQINLLSLTNYYGKDVRKIAIQLLNDGLIDFAGTDTHHLRHLTYLERINQSKLLKLIAPILKNNETLL